MRLLRSTCYRIQDHNQHLETDAILQESGSDRVFCIPCASIFICDRFESITAKLTVISELQYLAHAAVADPTVEKAALLSAIAQLIISCGSQSMLAPESLDALIHVARNIPYSSWLCLDALVSASNSPQNYLKMQATRLIAALLSGAIEIHRHSSETSTLVQPRLPRLYSDTILTIFFDALIHGDNLQLICEAAGTLDSLCSSSSDAARDALPIWARSYAGVHSWHFTLASYAVSDSEEEKVALLSVLRLLKTLVHVSRSLDTQNDEFITLSTDQSFLRALKTSMVSTNSELAISSALLVSELAQLDYMLAQQFLVCGNGIVDHIWDGVRTISKNIEQERDNDIACLCPFLQALEQLATASPDAFFDGHCSIPQMLSMLSRIISTCSKFETESKLAVACSSLNMACRLLEYIRDRHLPTDEFDTEMKIQPLFKALIKRLTYCKSNNNTTLLLAATRKAEWQTIRSIIETVALFNEGAVSVIEGETILDNILKTVVLTAMRTPLTSMHFAFDHSIRQCPNCALLKCIEALSIVIRDVQKQRLLEALLIALLPHYLQPSSRSRYRDHAGPQHLHCASLYAELLATIFRRPENSRHFRQAIFCAGGPHSLLMSMISFDAVKDPNNLTLLLPFINCFLLLYGSHTILDLVREDTIQDWCFVFTWFAVELRTFWQQQSRHVLMSIDEAIKALVHTSSEILTDIPNQRLSFAWSATRRKLAALFLVQTCATIDLAPTTLQNELLGFSTAALDSLLRASTFSALLDSGVLSDASGILSLLQLIATASHHLRSQIQLPPSVLGLIVDYFKCHDPSEHAKYVSPSVLTVIVTLPVEVIGKTLTVGLNHTPENDLCELFSNDFNLPQQLLTVLSTLENNALSRRATLIVCRALSKSILSAQRNGILTSSDTSKILEVLLHRILLASREVHAKYHTSFQDRELIMNEIYEITRAFAMTLLQARVSRPTGSNILRIVGLFFDALWRDAKQSLGDSHNRKVLLWCINAANASLSHATGNDRLTALKILGPYLETFVDLLSSLILGNESCRVASLVSIVFVALASSGATSVISRHSVSWYCGIRCDNVNIALKSVLHVMKPRRHLSCKDDAERIMGCWALAALLRTPAATAAVSKKALTGDLCDLIKLRTEEVLMMPLGVRGINATEGACCALVQLIALETIVKGNGDGTIHFDNSVLSSWSTFTGRWLLHQSPILSPYAALCVAALLNNSCSDLIHHCISVNIVNQLQDSAELSVDADRSTLALLQLIATACDCCQKAALDIAVAASEALLTRSMQQFMETKKLQQRRSTEPISVLSVYDDIFLPTCLESMISRATQSTTNPKSSRVVTDPELVDCFRCEDKILAAGAAASAILSLSSSST